MDINQIAEKILSATTHHFQNAMIMSLEKDDAKRQVAIDNMKHAESMLTETLEEFRHLIVKETGNR